ncbi:MAG: lamin tail domain-containing protein [Bacteroidetes bacterium]|nr:lamin tail domain-containing protein [Bacteroidota bacterium]
MKRKLLSLVVLAGLSTAAFAQCDELFFSEYVEGSGNSKAMEIYNPTSGSVNMANYRIVRYSNGQSVGADSLDLSGTLGAHSVYVAANGQTTSQTSSPACSPILQALADKLGNAYPDPLYFNGDDAMLLVKISPYKIIDIVGKIGEQPTGGGWDDVFPYNTGTGAYLTKDQTMIRKSSVTTGVTTNPTAFNAFAQWDTLPRDTWSQLKGHVCSCGNTGLSEITSTAKVSVYPNPTASKVNIVASSDIKSIEVYDALGSLVNVVSVADNSSKVQVELNSNLPKGLYFVNVKFADSSVNNKLVKVAKQ